MTNVPRTGLIGEQISCPHLQRAFGLICYPADWDLEFSMIDTTPAELDEYLGMAFDKDDFGTRSPTFDTVYIRPVPVSLRGACRRSRHCQRFRSFSPYGDQELGKLFRPHSPTPTTRSACHGARAKRHRNRVFHPRIHGGVFDIDRMPDDGRYDNRSTITNPRTMGSRAETAIPSVSQPPLFRSRPPPPISMKQRRYRDAPHDIQKGRGHATLAEALQKE